MKIYKLMLIIGKKILNFFSKKLYILLLIPDSIILLFNDIKNKKNTYKDFFLKEVYYSGVSSVSTIIFLGITIGMYSILLFPFDMISFGIKNIYGKIFITIFNYFAPIITSLIVVIRSSTYITIQITQMKVMGELDILETLGISPLRFIGSYRILTGAVIIPVLSIYFIFSSLSSQLITTYFFQHISLDEQIKEIIESITIKDIIYFFIKNIINGIIIFSVAIYFGLKAEKTRSMIISKTIQSLITSIVIILLFNYIFTTITYGIK